MRECVFEAVPANPSSLFRLHTHTSSLLREQRIKLRKQGWVSLTSGPPRPSSPARVSAVGKLFPPHLRGTGSRGCFSWGDGCWYRCGKKSKPSRASCTREGGQCAHGAAMRRNNRRVVGASVLDACLPTSRRTIPHSRGSSPVFSTSPDHIKHGVVFFVFCWL